MVEMVTDGLFPGPYLSITLGTWLYLYHSFEVFGNGSDTVEQLFLKYQ